MNLRKNMGIILMMLGVLLTVNQRHQDNEFFVKMRDIAQIYWPILLSFIGVYMVSTPKKRR
ncbi:MAG: hypothetical protein K2P09_06625 [Erysipelotrichales bacterium]|nr:hypothetical protein [Erysipelotrichales bacterium]